MISVWDISLLLYVHKCGRRSDLKCSTPWVPIELHSFYVYTNMADNLRFFAQMLWMNLLYNIIYISVVFLGGQYCLLGNDFIFCTCTNVTLHEISGRSARISHLWFLHKCFCRQHLCENSIPSVGKTNVADIRKCQRFLLLVFALTHDISMRSIVSHKCCGQQHLC